MAKFRPRKDQSERSDLPCHIIIINIGLKTVTILNPSDEFTSCSEYPMCMREKESVLLNMYWYAYQF